MRIIKKGQIPEITVYPCICDCCKTEFEFLGTDATSETEVELFIRCPVCTSTNMVSKDCGQLRSETELKEHNTIVSYIISNWDNLPKSTFNGEECVIFDCVTDEDYGWGNHSYQGYGVSRDGAIVNCSSSGCSCDGSCCMEPYSVSSTPETELKFDNYNPEVINFQALQVDFSDY